MSLKSVKSKIRSIDKTRQVTKAMESVSAVKMRKSQATAIALRPYATTALRILRRVSGALEAKSHPLMETRGTGKTLFVVVTADKGLAGSYGSSLLKEAYRAMTSQGLTEKDVELITIGKKAFEHFDKRGFSIIASYSHWSDGVTYEDIAPLADAVKERFLSGDCRSVHIIYANFVSTLVQEALTRQLLPVTMKGVEDVVEGIVPLKGKYSELRKESESRVLTEYSFEPSAASVLSDLIPELFKIQIFHSVLEANASEHSARMIAMKNASDNAKEISRILKLDFNKVRQAAITREVSEIVGGMEAMREV